MTQCRHCDEFARASCVQSGVMMTAADNEPRCTGCYDESYFTCCRCDKIFHLDDSNSCGSCDDIYCVHCWDNYHNFSCRYHDVSLCSDCYDHRHASCDSDDDNAYDWLYRTCDTKTDAFLSFEAGQTLHTFRPFGVEIECYALDADALCEIANQFPQAVGISSNGSLHGAHGVEFQTPHMAGISGERQITAMMTHLNERGFTVNQSCGLHVVRHEARI